MHWLDTATLSPDGQTATATCIVMADHPFLVDGELLPSALIELMAQGAAAGLVMKAGREGRRIRRGVLVGVREFVVQGVVRMGEVVEVTAVHERVFGPLTSGRMEARVGGRVVAAGRMTFHLEFEGNFE